MKQWSPWTCLGEGLCYIAPALPALGLELTLVGEKPGWAVRFGHREKGVASEAAPSSTSRGTPVLRVLWLIILMKPCHPELVFREIRTISSLSVYDTLLALSCLEHIVLSPFE